MALDKEKAQVNVGKVVDKLNEIGDRTSEKATQFAQEKGLDKKAEAAREKTSDFIREHKIDVAAEKTAGVIGTGLKKLGEGLGKAGEGIGKAGARLEQNMNERQEARKAQEDIFEEEDIVEIEKTDADSESED